VAVSPKVVEAKDFSNSSFTGLLSEFVSISFFQVRPPPSANLGVRDLPPQLLRFNLDVSKEAIGIMLEKDRITVHAMLFQDVMQIQPDWFVPPLVLFPATWLELLKNALRIMSLLSRCAICC